MRLPELSEPESVEAAPPLVRRFLFLAAIASVLLALVAARICEPGLLEVFGMRHDEWRAARDKALILVAGLPLTLVGLVAAAQGWYGKPKAASRVFSVLGVILNAGVLFGVGAPCLADYLRANS